MNRMLLFLSIVCWVSGVAREKGCSPSVYKGDDDVCWQHLSEHPRECSAQFISPQGLAELEQEKFGFSQAYFDPHLIERVAPYISLFPQQIQKTCNYYECQVCRNPIIRNTCEGCFDPNIDEDDVILAENLSPYLAYTCPCIKQTQATYTEDEWLKIAEEADLSVFEVKDREDALDQQNSHHRDSNWRKCPLPACQNSYFNGRNQKYFHFLEQYLKFNADHSLCKCYWPQTSKRACRISNHVYEEIQEILDERLTIFFEKPATYPYCLSPHEILEIFFTHAFFYSHYHHILIDLATYADNCPDAYTAVRAINDIYHTLDQIQPLYLELYTDCLDQHPHPKIHYERGMIYMHQGDALASLGDIQKLIDYAEREDPDLLSSDLYHQEGVSYAELGLYDKAVEALSKAIQLDPHNYETYFERAAAYFEVGDFDAALSDYLDSGMKPNRSHILDNVTYSLGMARGTARGGLIATVEFLPFVLHSFYGLGHALWTFAQDPVEVSCDLVNSAQRCIEFIRSNPKEILKECVPELKELVSNWRHLNEFEKGDQTGFLIGKYGVGIFGTMGATKGVKAFKDLKRANNLLTLEALSISKENKAILKAEALKRNAIRKQVLQSSNLKIQWDKQGKHIVGHSNYQQYKSILEHPDPQRLVNKFAGKGFRQTEQLPGSAGYVEKVNFEEFIGYCVEERGGQRYPTTWGKIHYAKDGVHIVPAPPVR